MKTNYLKTINLKVGKHTQTSVAIMYIEGIADNKVVKDIKNIKESDSINIVLGSGNVDAVVKGVNE